MIRYGKRLARGAFSAARTTGRVGARAGGGIGRAGAAVGRTTTGRRSAKGMIYGGAIGAGVLSGVMDKDSRWGDVQEDIYGERNVIGTSMKAGISNAVTGNPGANVLDQAHHSYYGRPFNAKSLARQRQQNVDGSINFGMYSMRRGY